jgi:hypothetical protein
VPILVDQNWLIQRNLDPTHGDIDNITGAIEMLEEQNSVLIHIMDNILQDRYQGLSQTSLTDSLSQVFFLKGKLWGRSPQQYFH